MPVCLSLAAIRANMDLVDKYLLEYENTQRRSENDVRRRARNALAREGVIASEGEIRKWRVREEEKDKANADAAQ